MKEAVNTQQVFVNHILKSAADSVNQSLDRIEEALKVFGLVNYQNLTEKDQEDYKKSQKTGKKVIINEVRKLSIFYLSHTPFTLNPLHVISARASAPIERQPLCDRCVEIDRSAGLPQRDSVPLRTRYPWPMWLDCTRCTRSFGALYGVCAQ